VTPLQAAMQVLAVANLARQPAGCVPPPLPDADISRIRQVHSPIGHISSLPSKAQLSTRPKDAIP
jgi:hypothetical protein